MGISTRHQYNRQPHNARSPPATAKPALIRTGRAGSSPPSVRRAALDSEAVLADADPLADPDAVPPAEVAVDEADAIETEAGVAVMRD